MKHSTLTLRTLDAGPWTSRSAVSSNMDSVLTLAKRILAEVMLYRRESSLNPLCRVEDCSECASPHLAKIISAIENNKAVSFVLPAFPGKSPNPEKVFSHLPDHAERIALDFLGNLCRRVQAIYPPGMHIIVCSDGRVFSDIVGMKEAHVSEYQTELSRSIEERGLAELSTFNLDDVYEGLSFDQMRDCLMKGYGQSLEQLKQKIRNGATPTAAADEEEANRMYRGITRFLFEDAMHAGQTKSRTMVQKEARHKAYEVIRRSNAWSQFIEERFPEAVRLSIHPQSCGSKKLGIRLIGNERWMTPWHGVLIESKDGFGLMKRSEAEALGAQLIYAANGRYSHYKILNTEDL